VEQQGVATREIASQVVTVAHATERASHAMEQVSASAEQSGASSQTVLVAAEGVVRISDDLRKDVDHFVLAMQASQTNGERRKYERISGAGFEVQLYQANFGTISAPITDISLGGAAVRCPWRCDAGTEIRVGLPGNEAGVPARVVAMREDCLCLAFRLDPATMAAVGRAFDLIAERAERSVAA